AEQFPHRARMSGARRFAPSPGLSLVLLLLGAIFVRLGVWQWHKGTRAQAEWSAFARGADQVVPLGTRAVTEVARFQRVSVSGQLDGAHQFLLDNRIWHGRAGYEVLTPLTRDGAERLLVDRGWVPFTGTRAQLPPVSLDAAGAVTLTGRTADLPTPGL